MLNWLSNDQVARLRVREAVHNLVATCPNLQAPLFLQERWGSFGALPIVSTRLQEHAMTAAHMGLAAFCSTYVKHYSIAS